ncbi:hypothetical protein SAMN05660206_109133 [Sphingobacterium wenxiniae]|uniref:Phospholipid/glycerol acyltransferase domain-containing protein n=2 Tax=Sphingobacterium wenxiniae TaxID=683125 RepID=A0A1I6UNI0_9SPHI|nr:hypothetical protein SAMN05660206_109133 [Sphingobacterium wenxiniae]
MGELFYHIYVAIQRHRIPACLLALLFLFGCGFIASKLRFEEDITQIIPQNERGDKTAKVLQQINFADKLTVLISKEDTVNKERMAEAAQTFLEKIAKDSTYIRRVSGQIGQEEMASTYDFVYQHLPLFLDSIAYVQIAQQTQDSVLREKVGENYRTLMSPTGFVMGQFIQKDPLGLALFGLRSLQAGSVGDNFVLYDGFIATKDTTQLLLFLDPAFAGADTEHNTALVEHLYAVRDSLQAQFQEEVTLSYYGAAFIAVANAKQIKADIMATVLISMAVLMLLLILFYKRIYIPLLVFIPTVFAALFAVACLYLYKPVVSAISLSIAAVLVGITIDYALHVLTHFKKSNDIKGVFEELTKPILMSGATNAVAFLCLLFVHSKALVDLGVFASICIFSSAVFTLIIIPQLYRPKKVLAHSSIIDRIAGFPFERSKVLIAVCVVLIVLSCFSSGKVGYNNNIADLNFVPSDIKKVEKQLDTLMNTSSKSLYVVATGHSFEEVAQQADSLADKLAIAERSDRILDYSGLHYIPLSHQRQAEKIASWDRFWSPDKQQQVKNTLIQEGDKYGFVAETHQAFYTLLTQKQTPISLADFESLQSIGMSDFIAERDGFYTLSTLVKVDDEQRTPFLKQMETNPSVVVIDRQNLNETFLGQLRDDFNRLVGYSFFAVLFILWVFFRRIELVLLSAIPIGLTGLVTAGLMGLFGLEFNIFSAIVCTLVFGHGVDFSIFMTAALQRQYTTGKEELQTYRTSILLAVLTTVLAIGALIFAKHPALISISSVSLIGVFSAILITFVFYPILFRFFISNRAVRGKSPFTIPVLLFSLLLFTYYGLGCLVISFIGRVLLRLVPIGEKRRDWFFRKSMSVFMKSVLYFHPLTKNKTINVENETFQQPAVIIANHSSFLDTLSMGMLAPKGIFLVNDWVWKSPIFGRAVRALGFYPVSQGLENGLTELREKVAQGYSLIVFPEGTRSYDNVLKRFHKGAFYLAEQLKLDIVPVHLLGNGDVLPKGDILIFKGKLTAIIDKRIKHSDTSFGTGYKERAKAMARRFKQDHYAWRMREEQADYFKHKLELAYLYKDESIVQVLKKSLKVGLPYYHRLRPFLNGRRDLVHLSDSFGEFDYLLSLQDGTRKITGVITDMEKRQLAESIYWQKLRAVVFVDKLEEAVSATLVLSFMMDAKDISPIALQSFQEIFTFKKEPILVQQGWKEEMLAEHIWWYSK